MRTLHVHAVNTVSADDLHAKDKNIFGSYQVVVKDGLTDKECVFCALEAFHWNQRVKVIEHFEFQVIDAHTRKYLGCEESVPPAEYNWYTFEGKVSDTIPARN